MTTKLPPDQKHLVGANHAQEMFGHFARKTATAAGKPIVFLSAVAVVVIWAVSGPLFGFSDTWQLVINTSTTIVTFLMVFLIQNTQNRDALAVQLKLAELILAVRGAENRLAVAEEMTDDELEELHADLRQRAEQTLDSLEERRAGRKRGKGGGEPAEGRGEGHPKGKGKRDAA